MKELSRRERTFEGDPDNWQKIVGELLETGPPYIGLLLHFYSGDQTTERFNFSRKRIPRSGNLAEEFWNLKEDELLLVDA